MPRSHAPGALDEQATTLAVLKPGAVLKESSDVPESLLGSADRRLRGFSLIAALGFLLTLSVDLGTAHISGPPRPEDVVLNSLSAALSLAMFFITRLPRVSPQTLMDLGLVYEVVLAFLISMAEGISDRGPGEPIWGISWVCLLIVLFPVLVPNRRFPSIAASVLAAATGPVSNVVAAPILGRPVPVSDLIDLYSPNVIALVLAVVLILFMEKLGRELTRARDLGSYRLVERIGAGSMGEVWRAEHTWLARPAAIKIIAPGKLVMDGNTHGVHDRFRREAEATATMTSPHTVTLYDYGITESGYPYYVMELLDGIDLQRFVTRFGAMPEERVAFLLRQICLSLHEAHEANLVHRDVKPANIYLCRKGRQADFVTVLDFGLVKPIGADARELTADAVVAGTPAYMAPEVARGEGYTRRSDIYSLGCVAYTLLCGRPVFRATGAFEVISAHLGQDPVPPAAPDGSPLSEAVATLVMGCLEKDPGNRPPDCLSILERLEAIGWKDPWTWRKASSWWESNLPGSPA